MTPKQRLSADVQATRELMNKPLGMIIEGVIGDARVKELFDQAGTHPSQYAGKPTGLIALDLKVITPATKTALLTAQAAERTLLLADKIEELEETPEKANAANVVSHEDKIFKFVDSAAQATWMGAQMVVNYLTSTAGSSNDFTNSSYVDGFRVAAAKFYQQAADALRTEGHTVAAKKLDDVAEAVGGEDAIRQPHSSTPHECLKDLLAQQRKDGAVPESLQQAISKALGLTTPPAAANPTAKRTARMNLG